jgi:PST family polysaccharide transporter
LLLKNAAWLITDRIVRIVVGLAVTILLARYLGPGDFGQLMFAIAFVSIFSAISSLGFAGVVVRDLVTESAVAGEILGTSALLRFFSGVVAAVAAIGLITWVRPDSETAQALVTIISFVTIFQTTEVVKYWFEAWVLSKYVVWAENAVFLWFAATRIALITLEAPLVAFAWTAMIEAFAVAVGHAIAYRLKASPWEHWLISRKRATSLIRDSWPLMLSGVAAIVYMRVDQVMLASMVGDSAVGVYSAAVRISEIWYFVPAAIVATTFPGILVAREENYVKYLAQLQLIYTFLVVLSLLLAIPMTFVSPWFVDVIFGSDYAGASSVLAIHIWAGVFVSLGAASTKWLIAEGLQKIAFFRTLTGAVVNVGLNIVLIPKHGPLGAAIATVISYSVAALWADLLLSSTRVAFVMKIRALLLIDLGALFKSFSRVLSIALGR